MVLNSICLMAGQVCTIDSTSDSDLFASSYASPSFMVASFDGVMALTVLVAHNVSPVGFRLARALLADTGETVTGGNLRAALPTAVAKLEQIAARQRNGDAAEHAPFVVQV
eukprot:SAG31_NODE_1797_length_7244_cov_8.328621_3_plen_111_part_00